MVGVRIALFAVGFTIAAQLVHAEQPTPPRAALTSQQIDSIDRFVNDEMARQHIPGLAVGVYSRGRILLAKGYGLADVELNVPVKPETVFQSGSVGKQFVSAATMMLVEEGKLSLDDSITKYFPDAPASWKPILIKNLLSHTSGLAEYESDERTGPKGPFYLRLDFTEDELIKKAEAMPIEWAPGEKWAYRNTNYLLLGILIQKITGEPYSEFLDERIFKPLGMTSTRLISDRDIVYNRASGYDFVDGQLKNQEWVSPTFNSTADGALYFNVLDLAKWDATLYTTRLLTMASLDRIWTVFPLNNGMPNPGHYGFGWAIDKVRGHKLIEHSGAWQGFTCAIERYPDDSLSTVVLTNRSSVNPAMIAHVVAGFVEPALMPTKFVPMADNDPEVAASLRSMLDRFAAGSDLHDQSTTELNGYFNESLLAGMRKELGSVWPGGTLRLVARQPSPRAPNRITSWFRLTKGANSLLIYYGRDADGKIADFFFSPDRPYW